VPPYASALVYARLGRRRLAMEWLERGYDAHDVHLVLIATDPKWDMFRGDARFVALLQRWGFSATRAGHDASVESRRTN